MVHAAAPFVYLAAHRDASYVDSLVLALQDVAQLPPPVGLGARLALSAVPEIELLARLVYYYSVLCLGHRTIGQEYCGTIPVHVDRSGQPQLLAHRPRLTLVAAHALAPYVIGRLQRANFLATARSAGSAGVAPGFSGRLATVTATLLRRLRVILSAIPGQAILRWLRRFHLMVFFLNGRYYGEFCRIPCCDRKWTAQTACHLYCERPPAPPLIGSDKPYVVLASCH